MYCILFAIWLLVCHWISIQYCVLGLLNSIACTSYKFAAYCWLLLHNHFTPPPPSISRGGTSTLPAFSISQSPYPSMSHGVTRALRRECLLFRSRSHLTPPPPPPLRGSHWLLFRSRSNLTLPPPHTPSTRQPLPTLSIPQPPYPHPLYEAATAHSFDHAVTYPPPPPPLRGSHCLRFADFLSVQSFLDSTYTQ